ncbi:hypothetical protein, partial [Escherichia coli]|uniref:hypothetical protein n=1 Tax=Escherichia coli TaxID=562 RepID=UPI001BA6CF27
SDESLTFTQTEEYFVCVCMSDYFTHLITHQNALSTEVDFSRCQVFINSQRGGMICMPPQY